MKVCGSSEILRASAIGSCVVVMAYDPTTRIAGMAHVMLPGASRHSDPQKRKKYAEDALPELLRKIEAEGGQRDRLSVWLVGGANVLGDGHESPGPDIVRSVQQYLSQKDMTPLAMRVGGEQRRACTLKAASGRISITTGDAAKEIFFLETHKNAYNYSLVKDST